MLTTAVFAICITAPAGAIMINTLGTKWLNFDLVPGYDEEQKGTGNKAAVAPMPTINEPTQVEVGTIEHPDDLRVEPIEDVKTVKK
jgi:hypothetical protein